MSTASYRRAATTRKLRSRTGRLGWIGLALGLVSLDLETLAFLGALYPLLDWYTHVQLEYGPALVTFLAMLALGGPFALAGVICSAARNVLGGRATPAIIGLMLSALSLAIPISYGAFVMMYLRGLI